MSRKSVLDLYPTVSTEAMVPAPETVVPLVFESEPEVLDETTELEGQIQETLAPTSNFTSQMVAAEQYLQVLTKFNQLDTQVSQEVYDTVRTTLGLETSDQPMSTRILKYIAHLLERTWHLVTKGYRLVKTLLKRYNMEFAKLGQAWKDIYLLLRQLLQNGHDLGVGLSVEIKADDLTSFSTTTEISQWGNYSGLSTLGVLIEQILFNVKSEIKSVEGFIYPGNLTVKIEDKYKDLSTNSGTVSLLENEKLLIAGEHKHGPILVTGSDALRLFGHASSLIGFFDKFEAGLKTFEKLESVHAEKFESLKLLLNSPSELNRLNEKTVEDINSLIRLRDRFGYVPELLKYFTTIVKNDIKIGEQILQIAKSKQ